MTEFLRLLRPLQLLRILRRLSLALFFAGSLGLFGAHAGASQTAQWLSKRYHVGLQYAGFAGERAITVGLRWSEGWHSEFMYGQTPIINNDVINQLSLKSYYKLINFRLNARWRWTAFYPGVLLTYANDDDHHIFSPNRYKEPTYYENKALRLGVVFGTAMRYRVRESSIIDFYLESVALDSLIVARLNNPGTIPLQEVFGLGMGLRLRY